MLFNSIEKHIYAIPIEGFAEQVYQFIIAIQST